MENIDRIIQDWGLEWRKEREEVYKHLSEALNSQLKKHSFPLQRKEWEHIQDCGVIELLQARRGGINVKNIDVFIEKFKIHPNDFKLPMEMTKYYLITMFGSLEEKPLVKVYYNALGFHYMMNKHEEKDEKIASYVQAIKGTTTDEDELKFLFDPKLEKKYIKKVFWEDVAVVREYLNQSQEMEKFKTEIKEEMATQIKQLITTA